MAERRYTKSHEWCFLQDSVATCGLSEHAAAELNDLTHLEFRVKVGDTVEPGDVFGEVDSVKATSELFAPVGGKVEALNDRFENEDELGAITASPEDEGWLIKIRIETEDEFEKLLTPGAYRDYCADL